jgi:hypothetical protein
VLHRVFTASPDGEHGTREIDMAQPAPAHPLVDRLFGPISDPSGARVLARELGVGLLLVGVLQAALAFAAGRDALADAAAFAITGGLVWATAGRLAAALALVAATGSAALSIATLAIHAPASGGRNIVLGLVAVWIAGRAVVATFAMHRLSRPAPP